MIIRVTDLIRGEQVNLNDIKLVNKAVIGIDASTNNSGICIADIETQTPLYSIELKRGKGVSSIEYKVEFKQIIKSLIIDNRSVWVNVYNIVQEEPFLSAMKTTSSVLMSLRTSVPELLIENKKLCEYFSYFEMNNKTWKKKLFAPDKCPNNSEIEKKMAKEKITALYPIYEKLSQDEIDAAGIAIISARLIHSGEGLKAKARVSKFKYNIEFIGAFDIDSAIGELNVMDIPDKVKQNGVSIINLPSNGDLDKKIYTEMGEEDMILLFEFSKKTAGNIVLKYGLHELASQYDHIYGVVWRQNRKN